ncbi:MAG: choice-of-anchor C family protein [Candidatus Eremiobacter antarcticus]|nr:choice-of-anchor C family protein [Candidatus Eremiobacteraeota bacterium]MBC5807070.1 choice-of-anchor C family protein [Candidatus Eremiobacteraeota bacterium]
MNKTALAIACAALLVLAAWLILPALRDQVLSQRPRHLGTTSMAGADTAQEHFRRGMSLAQQHNNRAAEAEFQAGETADPHDVSNFAGLADLYANQGKLDLADAQFRAALALSPLAPSLHYSLGLIEMKEKLYAAALADFNAELEIAPNFRPALDARNSAVQKFNARNISSPRQVGAAPAQPSPQAAVTARAAPQPSPQPAAERIPSPQASTPSLQASTAASPMASPQGPNLIANGSFEDGRDPAAWRALDTGSPDIAAWRVASGRIDYIGSYWAGSDGRRSVDLDGTPGPGVITQKVPTQAGRRYLVRFDLAGNPEGPPAVKQLRVSAGAQSSLFTFDISGHSTASMGWQPQQFQFTATSAQTTLQFQSMDGTSSWNGPVVDNVAVIGL